MVLSAELSRAAATGRRAAAVCRAAALRGQRRGARRNPAMRQRRLASSIAPSVCELPSPHCHVHEVTPRDGIQNEAVVLSLAQRLELVRLIATQLRPSSVEVASFVRGDLVPAMAHSAELCAAVQAAPWAQEARAKGMDFAALVPNARGYELFREACAPGSSSSSSSCSRGGNANANAAESGAAPLQVVDVVVAITSCTDAHSRANVLQPMTAALAQTGELIALAKQDGRRVQAYATMAFGCPYEGRVDTASVGRVVEEYVARGADKIILADTLGVAEPAQVRELVVVATAAGASLPRLGLHLHDAHGRAHENVQAGWDCGVRHFDSATSGCGGCNFVPDAKGNISTQALLRVLAAAGAEHTVRGGDGVRQVHEFLAHVLGRELVDW